ncbi:MAG: PrsW family intramembrane metalloprotease [Bacteroidales bacterium]|nr:PrsW family intramembrane metalloprotease [Bacteroidales bacterium]
MILLYICSLVPILLFIVLLILMDSFSLTSWKRLTTTTVNGALCYFAWHFLGEVTDLEGNMFAVPVFEELLKGLIIFILIARKKIALLGDATIYGAAVGAGFGLAENVMYLVASTELIVDSEAILEAILLGFEAAVMHIGCTSLLAMILIMVKHERFGKEPWKQNIAVAAAFIITCFVHFVHNEAPIPPIIMTAVLVVYFVISKRSLFKKNARQIHEWIDDCINNEIALLGAIRNGQLSTTNAGKYLLTLKESFDGVTFFDMCCFISEYLELSIAAKSNLILKEAGLPIKKDPLNKSRIAELKALKKRIGYTGLEALAPIVQMKAVDNWVVNELI